LATENGETEFFGTETMAELCARQGRLAEALRIYQHLIEHRAADERHGIWIARYQSLQRAVGYTGRAQDGEPHARQADRSDGRPEPRQPRVLQAPRDAQPPMSTRPDEGKTPVVELLPGVMSAARPPLQPPATPLPMTPDRVAWEALAQASQVHRLPLLITQPVRSGQVVRAEKNDLIVLGPVNPGAQLVADGNIHVYGPLRGQAIAGAMGCAQARIFCQKLDAELVAINGIYLIQEDIPPALLGGPAQVYIQDDRCLIDRL
jgi:septum formation inhibitor MinC